MTVAQLVHPAHDHVWQPLEALLRAPRRAAVRRRSRNAALWRAMATGLGFALIGLVMMGFAIGAAGVAPSAPDLRGGVAAIAQPLPNHHLQVYTAPAEAMTAAMPVP